jgi:hypothetical protein
MIGRIVGMLVGRKLKEKAVDAVLDKVNLPERHQGCRHWQRRRSAWRHG